MPRSPWFYVMVVLLGVLLISSIVSARSLLGGTVETVEYSAFISMVDEGQVDRVQIGSGIISFTLKTDSTLPRWFYDGTAAKTYQTVAVEDPYLVDRLLRAGVEFGGESSSGVSFISLLFTILPIAFYVVIIIMIIRMVRRGGAGGMGAMSFGKSSAKMYSVSDESKKFTDVAGQDEAKEALIELVDFLHQPEKYRAIGAKLPKGALLVGPPGTGKTLLAQAVAGEAKVPFFFVSGSAFVEMFVGTGAARVRDLFKQANEKAPCIIFIDEIDAIGKKRDAVGLSSNDEREQALNQLLAEMDGFDASKGIVVLGATNRPEILDVALLRPGRFDRRITVDLPDLRGREAVLRVHARGITMDKSVDFSAIARATVGASGADLANIVNESALRAVRMGRSAVTQDDLEASVETVIAGTERKSFVIPENEKRIVAYHEIGHALVAAHQKNAVPVQKITIIPRTSGALGYTMQVDEEEHVLMKREDILAKLAVLTAGRAAEEYACNTCTTGASNDIEQATKLARAMVTRYGMSDKFGMVALETNTNVYLGGDSQLTCSMETAAQIDAEVVKLIADAYDSAMTILKNNTRQLHDLAEYLLEKENISGEEFQQILAKDNEKITLLSDSSKEEIS
ncbi:MAG: ATP-dependent zinc metalloprotease FtsH [Clostridia bacterium]|nr:ATP-dependent zinc metalloprotease FtsH [Clostridia bacterium]MBQ9343127.1 ATP-dependent zinc metalloprotease FtsH [Clostridia bacterium]MBR6300587.1 ATP-dependent zinc metalloprotease FtsH [Clostridia bacterium]